MDEEYSEEEEEEEDSEQDEEKQRLRMYKKKKDRLASSSSSPSKVGSEAKRHWARLHWPVIQVAVMDVIANALVTIGFFYVGSGVRLCPFFNCKEQRQPHGQSHLTQLFSSFSRRCTKSSTAPL